MWLWFDMLLDIKADMGAHSDGHILVVMLCPGLLPLHLLKSHVFFSDMIYLQIETE